MKNGIEKILALTGICLLTIIMGAANATSSDSDCSDDDVQPPERHNSAKVIDKNV